MATYYVDPASIGGAASDANNGTSVTTPFLTLARALSITPDQNDRVLVRASTLPAASITTKRTQWATIQPYQGEAVSQNGGFDRPEFPPMCRINGASMIKFSAIRFVEGTQEGGYFTVNGGADHIEFNRCTFDCPLHIADSAAAIIDRPTFTNDHEIYLTYYEFPRPERPRIASGSNPTAPGWFI